MNSRTQRIAVAVAKGGVHLEPRPHFLVMTYSREVELASYGFGISATCLVDCKRVLPRNLHCSTEGGGAEPVISTLATILGVEKVFERWMLFDLVQVSAEPEAYLAY